MPVQGIDDLAKEIIAEEKRLQQYKKDIEEEFPDAQRHYDTLNKGLEELAKKRDELKAKLIEEGDYDIHQVDGRQFSISKVVKMKVDNIDEVDPDFKQTMEVADEKRAAKYYKLYGEAPKGFVDNSYNKINWKEVI